MKEEEDIHKQYRWITYFGVLGYPNCNISGTMKLEIEQQKQ